MTLGYTHQHQQQPPLEAGVECQAVPPNWSRPLSTWTTSRPLASSSGSQRGKYIFASRTRRSSMEGPVMMNDCISHLPITATAASSSHAGPAQAYLHYSTIPRKPLKHFQSQRVRQATKSENRMSISYRQSLYSFILGFFEQQKGRAIKFFATSFATATSSLTSYRGLVVSSSGGD